MRNHRTVFLLAWPGLLLGCLLLGSCAMNADIRIPETSLPPVWPENMGLDHDGVRSDHTWWTRFQDPVLDRLVDRAVHDNKDVRLQAARVQEARARLGFAKSEQLPTVGFQAEAVRQRQSGAALSTSGTDGSTDNLFSFAGVLDYELDIWGRLAMEQEAAQADLLENQFVHEAVRLNVIADVVVAYFNLMAAKEELSIVRKTAASLQETYALERFRYQEGQINELVLRQAQSQMETTQAMIPVHIRQVRTLEGVLGILTGLNPKELFDDHHRPDGVLQAIQNPGPVPLVLPSTILERRPDIRAADTRITAAGAAIGIARANRLPRLNLAGLLGMAAISTGDLFTASARNWQGGGQAAGPVFDFGRNKARVQTARAQYVQTQIQYEATVNTAFNEVRDALWLYQSAIDHQHAVQRQLATIKKTRHLAWVRYREGLVSFIEFLDADRALFAARQTMNDADRDRLVSAATLFKALGGGWNPDSVASHE
jgi:multidrug efflux system outer membrane protein